MLCVYEDKTAGDFGPLVDLRPIFELRCGMRSFFEKIRRLYPKERVVLWVRDEVVEVVAELYPECLVNVPIEEPALFISGSAILFERVPVKGDEGVLVCDGRVAGFRWKGGFRVSRFEEFVEEKEAIIAKRFKGKRAEEVRGKVVEFPWELIDANFSELKRELKVEVKERGRVKVGRGARLDKGAYVATECGPVFLDRESEIRPGSFVEGPCYIGKGTIIDGALVRPGCSFGPQCRIGGEVEASIFQGYANKRHEGFIGHSFIGEWVNLGALTTGSDLKNNYQPVRVSFQGKWFETGVLKLGCFVGDHVKTAIGTLLPTGAVLGTFANWFESGFTPKELARFSWGKDGRWREKEMLECARRVMARRGVEMSPAYERLLLRLYQKGNG